MSETHTHNPADQNMDALQAQQGDLVRQLDPSIFEPAQPISDAEQRRIDHINAAMRVVVPEDSHAILASDVILDQQLSKIEGIEDMPWVREAALKENGVKKAQEALATQQAIEEIEAEINPLNLSDQDKTAKLIDMFTENEQRVKQIKDKNNESQQDIVPQQVIDHLDRRSGAIQGWLDRMADTYPGAREQINSAIETVYDEVWKNPQKDPRLESQITPVEAIDNKESITTEEAIELISYTDVVPEEQKTAMIEATKQSPNGMNYVNQLVKLSHEYGADELDDRAEALVTVCKRDLATIGLKPSKFGESKSWALWDIAKQSYYNDNPESSDPNYDIEDPMSSTNKMDEILNRHLGWEIYDQLAPLTPSERAQRLSGQPHAKEIAVYLDMPAKKDNNTLSSRDLARLGALLQT